MKKLSIIGLLLVALIGFNSCKTEDDVVFTAKEGALDFSNTFLSEYILTPGTASNIAERFTWNSTDVGAQTNITYSLERSILGDFSDDQNVGATTGNEIAVTVGEMLGFAAQLGLDADPTTDMPNSGDIAFRLRSVVGDSGVETISSASSLTLVLPEDDDEPAAVCEFETLYGVGAGLPTAGWSWDTPVTIGCSGTGVYSANVDFTADGDANFRFFTANTDWGSGRNYPYYVDNGYTIDANLEDAMDGDNNFRFIGTSGLYLLTIDDTNKTITLGEAEASGTCEFDRIYGVGAGLPSAGWSWDTPVQILCTGTGIYSGNVQFTADGDANFRFFTANTDWGSGRNFPYYVDNGYTIDANFEDAMDGDNNFRFIGTSGTYLLTIDDTNKTITLE